MSQRGSRPPSEVVPTSILGLLLPSEGSLPWQWPVFFFHGHNFDTGWFNLGDSPMQDEILSPLLSSISRALYPYLLLALHDLTYIHPYFLAVSCFGTCMSCFLLRVQCNMILVYKHLISETVTLTKYLVISLIKAIHISTELLVNAALSLASVA